MLARWVRMFYVRKIMQRAKSTAWVEVVEVVEVGEVGEECSR